MASPIIFKDSDFSDLASFRLWWRWTRADHAQFSREELKMIQPLLPEVARRAYGELEREISSHIEIPGQNFFSCGAQSLDVALLSRKAVSNWLRDRLPKDDEKVIVSWFSFGRDVAVLVEQELFVNRWDDFCYPSSDDIDIWSPRLFFVLRYSHDWIFSLKAVQPKPGFFSL